MIKKVALALCISSPVWADSMEQELYDSLASGEMEEEEEVEDGGE